MVDITYRYICAIGMHANPLVSSTNAFMRFTCVFDKVRFVVVAITSASVDAPWKVCLHATHNLYAKTSLLNIIEKLCSRITPIFSVVSLLGLYGKLLVVRAQCF